MAAIILQTRSGQLLGALLVARGPMVLEEGGRSDFVLTGVPKAPELFDLPESRFIQENKHIEGALSVDAATGVLEGKLRDWIVRVELPAKSSGTWSARRKEATEIGGSCVFPRSAKVSG